MVLKFNVPQVPALDPHLSAMLRGPQIGPQGRCPCAAGLAPSQGARGAPGAVTPRQGSAGQLLWRGRDPREQPGVRQYARPQKSPPRSPPLPSILSGRAGRSAALPSSSGVGSARRALAATAPRCRSCPSPLRAARAFSLCLKVGEEMGAGGGRPAGAGCGSLGRKGRAALRWRPGREVVHPFFLPCTGTWERGSLGGSGATTSSGRTAGPRGERRGHGCGHRHWHRAGPGSALRPPPPGEPGACREPGGGWRRPQPPSAAGAGGRSGPCPQRPHGCLCFLAGCLLWIIKSRRSRHYRASVLKPEKEVSYRTVPPARTGCQWYVYGKTSVSVSKQTSTFMRSP